MNLSGERRKKSFFSPSRPPGPGDLTKRNLNIRKYGLRIPGMEGGSLQRTAGSEPARGVQSLPVGWRSLQTQPGGPRRGGLTSPKVTPSRSRHRAGPPWSLFSKLRYLTMYIPCSSLLNGLLIFLIFKIIGDSSEGVQFYLSPKLCIYIYFHPQLSSPFVTLIRVF